MTTFKITLAAIAIAATGATAALADDTGGNNAQPLYGAGMTNAYNASVSQSSGTQFAGNRATGLSSSDALVLKQLESGEVAIDRN